MARYMRRTAQSLGHSELRPPAVIGAGIVFRPVEQTLVAVRARVERPRRFGSTNLRPPVVVNTETFTPCAFTTDDFNRANGPLGTSWSEFAGVTPLVISGGALALQTLNDEGSGSMNLALNPLGALQMSVTVTGPFTQASTYAHVGFAGMPGFAEAVTLQISQHAISLVTAGLTTDRTFVAGDQFALTYQPLGATERLAVWHKPVSGPWQKVIETERAASNWAAAGPVRSYISGFEQVGGDFGIGDFSVCPYTNAPVGVHPIATTVSRRNAGTKRFYRLAPPTIVGAAAVFIARPIQTHLAPPQVPQQSGLLRRQPYSRLRPPAVVGAGIAYFGPGIRLAPSSRGVPKSKLEPPAVVAAEEVVTYFGPQVTLTYSRRGRPLSQLLPPAVINTDRYFGPKVTLARNRPQPTSTLLRPPVIPPLARPTVVSLAPQSRGKPLSHLQPPTVVFLAVELSGPEITLAPSSRLGRQPHSRLAPPVVVFLAVEIYGPETTFAQQSRGKPFSVLSPPPTVGEPEQFRGPKVTLAPQPKPETLSRLFPPAVVGAGIVYRPVLTHLAYSLRGQPLSKLQPPTVVAAPTVFFGPHVTLTRIQPRPTTTALGVFPPQAVVYAPITVHLTYSRRGAPHSFLRGLPPDSERRFYGPLVHLTYSRRGKPLSHLAPPAVVGQPPFRAIQVHLAYSLRGKPFSQLLPVTPGKDPFRPVQTHLATNKVKPTVALLKPPAVVQPITVIFFGPAVNLTYSRRGEPTSKLRPPAVVGAGIVYRALQVKLTYSRRGRPLSHLAPPAVVAAPELFFGPQVELTYSRRGRPLSVLHAPVVLHLQEFDLSLRRIRTHLTYSLRGRPIYELQPPQVVREAVEIYGPEITLAPSRFPKPKSQLLPPAVVGQPPFRPVQVHLAQIKPQPTTTRLAPPTIVRLQPFRGLLLHLTYSRRGVPKSFLTPPTVVRLQPFRGILLHLAPSSRGVPKSKLIPPAVVGQPPFRGLLVRFTYSLRGVPKSRLFPPAVIGAGIVFAPIEVHIVRITPPPTMVVLRPPTAVITERPGDVICEDDTPFSTVCVDDDQGAQITGGVSATGGTLTGGDSAAG